MIEAETIMPIAILIAGFIFKRINVSEKINLPEGRLIVERLDKVDADYAKDALLSVAV